MPTICRAVFHLPDSPAAMTTPSEAAMARSEVTATSRPRSTTTIHGAMRPMRVR
jgi:hypothetical protein